MQLLLLSICLSIFSLGVESASEPYYAITVPAQMWYPSEERACITILKLKGELQLKMELKKEERSVLVAEDTISKPTYFNCYSFELPSVVGEEVWFFHVSAHGDNININQTKKIMLFGGTHITYIQTDKPNYKPGQTVSFRIITLDKNFHAKNDKYPLVELTDPNNNRIQQWLDVSPHQGIADLSFHLADELPLGVYSITIPNVYKAEFYVLNYVLKRFAMTLDIPEIVNAMDKSLNVKSCGSYTYGKPVSGSFGLFVCKENFRSFYLYSLADKPEDIDDMDNCQKITGVHTDDKGCLSKEIDLGFFNISKTTRHQLLTFKITLTDDVSGDTEKALAYSCIALGPTMHFEKIPEFYQKGIPFTVKLKVSEGENKPKVNETVYLELGFEEEEAHLTSVTNEEGIAVFTVDTSTWDDMVSVSGKMSLEEKEDDKLLSNALTWLHPLYSESNSYLNVETKSASLSCDLDQHLTVEYIINTSQLDPVHRQLHFFYFYISKGVILTHGEYDLNIRERSLGSVLQGNFTLKIPIGIEYFPNFIFVVYTILDNGDIPSYTKEFTTSACLKNKITLKFNMETVRPGEKVNLEVEAEPGSLCSVRSVDKGLLLHREHNTLEGARFMLKMIAAFLKVNKRGWPYSIEDFEKYPCLRNEQDPQAGLQEAAWYHGDADVYMMLKQSNIKIVTNTKIRKPVMCTSPSFLRRIAKQSYKTVEVKTTSDSKSEEEKIKFLKRTFFPETWLYDLVSVGPQGHTVLDLTTPHSITTWKTDAFCLGKSGLGETSGVGLTTFQPYFIDLILPYSVVQGEKFTITTNVFSYLKACMKVFVSLSDLKNNPTVGNLEQSQCICEDQSATFTWEVSASKPGNLKVQVSSSSLQLEGGCTDQPQTAGKDKHEDTVEKTIIVQSFGILKEDTHTFLLCSQDLNTRRTVTLEVSEKMVPGSDQALITVFGNLLGSAIANIGTSINLPSGSGEQNLKDFIPISHIVKFLESINELTPEIKEKAKTYLTKGYLSQLTFKKDDGSYSVYHGMPGSAWLTAFTMKAFSHAQSLIYIQEKHIDDAVKWLSSLQQPSGCFKEVGKIFNNYLLKENDNVTLTAYITIALLERGQFYNGTLVENALKCLKNAVNDVTSTYTQALLAYVFALSGDSDLTMQVLKKDAIGEDGSMNWAEKDYRNVEIASYILLAVLADKTTSQSHAEVVSSIVTWIIKQQGQFGGFYSTQDTAVALQALTKYAKATYVDNLDVTVSVRSLSGFYKQFHVDKKNSLLMQREILPDIPGEYTLSVTGTGCAYIQTYLKYHTTVAKSDAFFSLNVSTQPSVCANEAKTGLDILVEASYSGERTTTNTVIIEIQLLSGFLPKKESVKKLRENPNVKRTKITPEKVIIFLDTLTHETESLRISIKQELLVKNLQAAKVKIYDYYAPEEHAVTSYSSPCSTENVKES
ncbi:alpha-2-macroglobulin-like protein 1 [Dendropsophus ebraccatus]|uniref:alpha-2-macroglobulin-like protein 1 n=1 Tax=Dendropsophus ebraccatus TaxID=150705 RepID=UPI003831C287